METETKEYKNPLGKKILAGCAIFSVVCCLMLGLFDAALYATQMFQQKQVYLDGVLQYTLTELDGDALEACMASGVKDEQVQHMEDVLDRIRTYYDVDFIEIVVPQNTNDADNVMYVITGATQEERAQQDENVLASIGDLSGEEYSAKTAAKYMEAMTLPAGEAKFFTDKSGGNYEYTGACPIMNAQGETVALLTANISINEIVQGVQTYIIQLIIEVVVLIGLFIFSFYLWLKKRVLQPISKIKASAEKLVKSSHEEKDPARIRFEDPDIHSEDELQALSESLVTLARDLKQYMEELLLETKEKERIGAELNVATNIQASMLPSIFPPYPNRHDMDIFAFMHPAKEVGGDFYDFFLIDETHLAVVMADVSGKGVPAALFMVISKTLIKIRASRGGLPSEILSSVNNQLCENNGGDLFVTAWLGILDLTTGHMIAANAGHEYPVFCKKDGTFELIKDKHGFVLAGIRNSKYTDYEFDFAPGDMLYIYTDGVPEATNAKNELFGTERMLAALNDGNDGDCEHTLHRVMDSIQVFVGEADQFDDITMLSLKYYGPNGRPQM